MCFPRLGFEGFAGGIGRDPNSCSHEAGKQLLLFVFPREGLDVLFPCLVDLDFEGGSSSSESLERDLFRPVGSNAMADSVFPDSSSWLFEVEEEDGP
jgi:hypothetical protein